MNHPMDSGHPQPKPSGNVNVGGDVDHDLIAMANGYGDRYADSDLYKQIDKSQARTPWWLWVMVGVVMVLAVALNAPFLKGAAGAHGFLDWGMLAALFYVGGGFVFLFWYTWMRKRS